MNNSGHIEPCDCAVCQNNNNHHKQVFNQLAQDEGLSEDEMRMMRNTIEDLTGFNLA